MLHLVYTTQRVMNKSEICFNGSFNNSALCTIYYMIPTYTTHISSICGTTVIANLYTLNVC